MVTHMDQSLEYDIYQTVIVTTTKTHISYSREYRDTYESVRVKSIMTHMNESWQRLHDIFGLVRVQVS